MLIGGEDDKAILDAEDAAIVESEQPKPEPTIPVADDLAELLKVGEDLLRG